MKLLVVDDQRSVFMYIQRAIDMPALGIGELCYAQDGLQALQRIGSEQPDIMLLDIQMPRMNGLELLAQLRKRGMTQPATIILSAYDDFSFAQRAIEYKVLHYLLKPIDPQEMTRVLQSTVVSISPKADPQPAARILVPDQPDQGGEAASQISNARIMAHVKEWIDRHYSEELTLSGLSAMFYIDRFQLSRLFKRTFGINFQDYILQVRMKEAARLMLLDDQSLGDVSRAVGFEDPGYFSNVFKKYYGVSPRKYRKDQLKEG